MNKTVKPILIIFGGLPGAGKTTLAKELSKKIGATYLRIDTMETAIKQSLLKPSDVIDAGYMAGFGLAVDNLMLGNHVVADSVNPIELSRQSWRDCALKANVPFIEIEVLCSNIDEHKHRIQTRVSDIKGHVGPTWSQVEQRQYELWKDIDGIRVDTSLYAVEELIHRIIISMQERQCDKEQ
tara:strand:+ start:699 stop:1244 length:546 start_codon:yes stop_codon:yes gene_type:complete